MPGLMKITIESPLKGAVALIRRMWTKGNEIVLNIKTLPDRPLESLVAAGRPYLQGEFSDKAKYDDNVWYESPDYWYLYKIARIIQQNGGGQGVFYDIGSGKGRVLCVMARHSFKKVAGIELFEDLCYAARTNANLLRGRKAAVEIRCEDAARADMADGTIYFMFNPFGEDTMREVLENIRQSLLSNPREISIVYYNAVHEDLLESTPWLKSDYFFRTATGRKVSFWKNTLATETIQPQQMIGATNE